MCWMCKASNTTPQFWWTNAELRASWKALRTTESYVADCAAEGIPICPVTPKIRGLGLGAFTIDVLHCVDLGVTAHILGNALWACMQLGPWGATQAEQLASLQSDIHKWVNDAKSKASLRGDLTRVRSFE